MIYLTLYILSILLCIICFFYIAKQEGEITFIDLLGAIFIAFTPILNTSYLVIMLPYVLPDLNKKIVRKAKD